MTAGPAVVFSGGVPEVLGKLLSAELACGVTMPHVSVVMFQN
jgi:hypothetical protein